MSLILDALNRSDSERANPDAAPGLQSVHGAFLKPSVPLWRRALWPVLALVLAIVAVLPWLGDRNLAPEARRAAKAAEPVAPGPQTGTAYPAGAVNPASAPSLAIEANLEAPVKAPIEAPIEDPIEAPVQAPVKQAQIAAPVPERAPPREAVNADVAALYQSRQSRQSGPSVPVRVSSPVPRETAIPADSSAVDRSAAATDPQAGESPAVDVNALAAAAEVALTQRRAGAAPVMEHEAPFIAALSQPVKDQIPSIFYSAHQWASNPSQRSVVLNGQERRAGQQVKPGLRLVEILEDSIVLDFHGTEFRLRSLNSWVNL